MSLVTFVPAPGFSGEQGIVNAGGGVGFDVGAALVAGSGQIVVDNVASSVLAGVLSRYPGLIVQGTSPGIQPNVDVISAVQAHSLRSDKSAAQAGDALVKGSDGLYLPATAPSGGGGSSSSEDALMAALGIVAWTFDPQFIQGSVVNITGHLRGQAVYLLAGTQITHLAVNVWQAGANLAHGQVGIYQHDAANSRMVELAASEDTPTAFQATGWVELPLTSTFIASSSGAYFFTSLFATNSGGTMPSIAEALGVGNNPAIGQMPGSGAWRQWYATVAGAFPATVADANLNPTGDSLCILARYVTPPSSAPANTAAPAITGTAQSGSTLTCSQGTWTNAPTSYAYQWQTDASGSFANIVGATTSTYTCQAGDVGHNLRCVVTASNAAGPGSPANSNTVGAVAAGGTSPAFVQKAAALGASASTTIAQAYAGAVTSGSCLVAAVVWADGAGTSTCSVADSVNGAWTAIGTPVRDATVGQATQLFYRPNTGAGTPTVTATFSASNGRQQLTVAEYSGIATATPVDVANALAGTTDASGNGSIPLTTTHANDMLIGIAAFVHAGAAGSGLTLRDNTDGNAFEDAVAATAGSNPVSFVQTFSGTPGAYQWVGAAVALHP